MKAQVTITLGDKCVIVGCNHVACNRTYHVEQYGKRFYVTAYPQPGYSEWHNNGEGHTNICKAIKLAKNLVKQDMEEAREAINDCADICPNEGSPEA